MNIFKRLFGKKEKPKEEVPLLPINEEQPLSVPIEEIKIGDKQEWITPPGLEELGEPIAPTLERQDETISDKPVYNSEKFNVTDDEIKQWEEPIIFKSIAQRNLENKKKKSTKPKKQAKKKDNRNPDDERKNWPGFNHFNL